MFLCMLNFEHAWLRNCGYAFSGRKHINFPVSICLFSVQIQSLAHTMSCVADTLDIIKMAVHLPDFTRIMTCWCEEELACGGDWLSCSNHQHRDKGFLRVFSLISELEDSVSLCRCPDE